MKIFLKKIKEAVTYVRKNKKPIFLEFDTMRTCGHVGPENDDKEYNYRNKDLIYWRKRDSFKSFRTQLIKNNNLHQVKRIEKANKNKVIFAVEKARKANFLKYEKSLKFNFVKSYSKIIKNFSEPSTNFHEKQKETKLNPY